MMYLLDTNVCIKYLNGQSDSVCHKLEKQIPGNVGLCSVVKAELLYGALKSSKPKENIRRLDYFFQGFPSFPFDDTAASMYAEIRPQLEMQGKPIGPNDLIIAAVALSNQVTLVTHNTKEFGRINGITLEDWEI